MREQKCCDACGSGAVLLDAYSEWDFENQMWTLQNTFDAAICDDADGCDGGECTIATINWDDADDVEKFLRTLWEKDTDDGERPPFEAWHGALLHDEELVEHTARWIALRLHELWQPKAAGRVTWEFVRVEPKPSHISATYYCAADPLQEFSADEVRAAAHFLGPGCAAVRDDENDWVFLCPLVCTGFTVDAAAMLEHVHTRNGVIQ